jgi:transcriptional regulator with XRE-family HTH domain
MKRGDLQESKSIATWYAFMYRHMMRTDDINGLSIRTRHLAKRLRITQQKIAEATGLSQSQVSRLLSGKSVRRSDSLDRVCVYVKSLSKGVTPSDVRGCAPLVESLALVWDGSQSHAEALAVVIRSLGTLSTTGRSR